MQKTAFKVFLCSFSVSMLAMSVANRIFLHTKNYDTPPLDISEKNISLFLKDTNPRKYPVKKIDLSILDDMDITPHEDDYLDLNDSIVVADEINFQDASPDEKTEESFNDTNEAEDQKIFLADVVYSQDNQLESLAVNEKIVYSPEEPIITDGNSQEEVDKPVVYADNSIKEPIKFEVPKVENNKTVEAKPTDSLIPIMYNGSTQTLADISIDNPDNLNNVAMKISNAPIESMSNNISSDKETSSEDKKWRQMTDNPWLVARSNGSKKNKFSEKNLGTVDDQNIEDTLNIQKPKKGVDLASETVKNLVIPLPEKLAGDENLMPKLAYPEDSSDAKKEKAMNALSLRQEKEKEQHKLLTPIEEDEEDISMAPPEEETIEKPKNKGLFSSIKSLWSDKTEDLREKLENAANKAKAKLTARKNLKLAADANRRISIVPKEIRMSFQPNKAEISGQTLRWVQAFATKAAQEESVYLEVRVDASRPTTLQKRRLNLLYNILTNKGVEYSKINIVYTSREPNSFILRMVNMGETEGKIAKKIKKTGTAHIQW